MARQKSSKIASRHKLAAILDIVGNVRYRRRERSVASRLPKPDRKLSDYNRKGYRAFPTAVADIPDYIQDGRQLASSGQQKTGSKTEHRAANGKCAVLPMDLSTTLAEGFYFQTSIQEENINDKNDLTCKSVVVSGLLDFWNSVKSRQIGIDVDGINQNGGGSKVSARPRVGSPDGRRPEGDPTRGRAGTEGDAEYTVLYFIYVIPTQEHTPFNAR
ncbi:hypothetical protein Bbelb_287440 [Branchiostoma belcheri]|nr:hypothetical protein Bbelb_287440 [Branchiostoma belcheri]